MMNTLNKIGRNDPCGCGSGKKYKNCYGRKERASSRVRSRKPIWISLGGLILVGGLI